VVPRKGAIVASLSPRDIADFYDLKMVLEGYAARCAVTTLKESDLTKMEMVNRQIEASRRRRIFAVCSTCTTNSTTSSCAHAGTRSSTRSWQNLVMQFRRFRLILSMPGRIEGSIKQHWEIIDAFRKRDRISPRNSCARTPSTARKILLRELAKA